VEATPREIFVYETPDGKAPFSDWMDAMQGHGIYDKIMVRLDRVEQGNLGEHRGVGAGVFELVIDDGPGYRVYFGQDGKDIVILLIAGTKKTQTADIERAKSYWRNYNA
jgi:putative addiction module killer protein